MARWTDENFAPFSCKRLIDTKTIRALRRRKMDKTWALESESKSGIGVVELESQSKDSLEMVLEVNLVTPDS